MNHRQKAIELIKLTKNRLGLLEKMSFISKILEKIVFNQLVSHLNHNDLIVKFQSAYRSGHSTETALLKVTNDLLCNIDSGDVAMLTMLDLSAAFDTLDHDILIHRLLSPLAYLIMF